MARFIGYVQGNRGQESRLGTERSGIEVAANGWNVGVGVRGHVENGGDVFYVYATGGSSSRVPSRLIACVKLDENGDVCIERP